MDSFERENTLCLCVLYRKMYEGLISAHDLSTRKGSKKVFWGTLCSQTEKCYRGFLSPFSFTELQPNFARSVGLLCTVRVSRLHFVSLSAFISSFSRALWRSVSSICVHKGQCFFNNTMAKVVIYIDSCYISDILWVSQIAPWGCHGK